jgi:hypothetical protein
MALLVRAILFYGVLGNIKETIRKFSILRKSYRKDICNRPINWSEHLSHYRLCDCKIRTSFTFTSSAQAGIYEIRNWSIDQFTFV